MLLLCNIFFKLFKWNNVNGISAGTIQNPKGTKILNNTGYDNRIGFGINVGGPLWGNKGAIDTQVFNNIAYKNAVDFKEAGTNTTQNNNLFGIDPKFVNAGAADFHLTAASTEAIDKGVTLSEFNFDHDYGRRPFGSAFDIGAYEFGSTPGEVAPPGWTGPSGGGTTGGTDYLLELKDINCIPPGNPVDLKITVPPGAAGVVYVGGLMPGFTLSAGTPVPNTNAVIWEVPISAVPTLTVTPPSGFKGQLGLSVSLIPPF